MTTKTAIIIGNGTSRKSVNLKQLSSSSKTYGCNALYRDFPELDYLVAIDEAMITIIKNVDFSETNTSVIIPPENERWEHSDYNPQRRRSNAGMCAMTEAIRHGSQMLYCLGFDFVLDGKQSIDNIYSGTPHYDQPYASNESDNFYRVKYLQWFANQNSNVTFVMIIPDTAPVSKYIAELGKLRNVIFIRTSTFLKKLKSVEE